MSTDANDIYIYQGIGKQHRDWKLPEPPHWRFFTGKVPPSSEEDFEETELEAIARDEERGKSFRARQKEVDLVNAALLLRRPLLITGQPGSGKSTLAYAVAYELGLGRVLHWQITSRSTLTEGLYQYDAIGRLQSSSSGEGNDQHEGKDLLDFGQYIRLGPLGTALLPSEKPRVLLIDEIDKSDIDLPNALLHAFEEGSFRIQELVRHAEHNRHAKRTQKSIVNVYPWDRVKATVPVENGQVHCRAFPFVVMTSNGERVFPPAFRRRCIPLEMPLPDENMLKVIIKEQLKEQLDLEDGIPANIIDLITKFKERQDKGEEIIATDQLLNAIYLRMHGADPQGKPDIYEAVLRALNQG